MDILEGIAMFLGAIVLVAIIALILSLPVMWLWNWLVPTLFAGPVISWGEALGLQLLLGFLIPRGTTSKSS